MVKLSPPPPGKPAQLGDTGPLRFEKQLTSSGLLDHEHLHPRLPPKWAQKPSQGQVSQQCTIVLRGSQSQHRYVQNSHLTYIFNFNHLGLVVVIPKNLTV